MRAEFQVQIIPFIKSQRNLLEFCVFKRNKPVMWQFISGGGEDSELPIEAAIRESFEEAQIKNRPFYKLDTTSSIPTYWFKAHANKPNLYVVPEYCFAVELDSKDIVLSDEHSEFEFCDYKKASELLRFDNNKTALWELRKRLERNDLKEV